MTLSNAQKAQVTMWMENNSLVTNCPLCADIDWEFAGLLLGIPYPDGDNAPVRVQAAHPMVQAVCTKCGYVLLLSARVLGLLSDN